MIRHPMFACTHAAYIILCLLGFGLACDSGGIAGDDPSHGSLSTAGTQIAVSPSLIQFGSSGTQVAVSIQNPTGSLVYWNAGTSRNWLKFSESNGQIESGRTQTIAVHASRSGLNIGDYQGSIQIRSTAGSFTIPVTLRVSGVDPTPQLSLAPTALDFGATQEELSLKIENTGGGALDWNARPSSGWLRLGASSGSVAAGASQTVAIRVERSQVEPGVYQARIDVQSAGGSGSVAIRMEKPEPEAASGSIVDVRRFGARGDGQADDAPAFRAAIDALPASGGTVYIPAGVYRLRPINGPYRSIDLSKMTNVTILGEGTGVTTLRMAGGSYLGAAFMFVVFQSSNISIRNLTIDMNRAEAFYGDEQSHQIRVVSSTDVLIDRVHFQNGPGDGVYLLGVGEPGEPWTQRVRILNSAFSDLWRNGVTIQRGVENVEIIGNTFERLGDQAVSSEPSGSGASPRVILVADNRLRHSTANWAVAMSGARLDEPLRGLKFRNNVIENGSAYFQRIESLEVAGNRVLGERWHSPLRLENVRNASVVGNTITGVRPDQTDGTLQLVNEQGALSSGVVLTGNTIIAATNSTGIYVRDAKGNIAIIGNVVTGVGSKKGVMMENLLSTGSPRTGFSIASNQIKNFQYSIVLSSRGDPYSSVEILRNVLNHNQQPSTSTVGILFSIATDYRLLVELVDNTFGSGILRPIFSD